VADAADAPMLKNKSAPPAAKKFVPQGPRPAAVSAPKLSAGGGGKKGAEIKLKARPLGPQRCAADMASGCGCVRGRMRRAWALRAAASGRYPLAQRSRSAP
jgi:hypothetical protein